jgi:hypothetical protein
MLVADASSSVIGVNTFADGHPIFRLFDVSLPHGRDGSGLLRRTAEEASSFAGIIIAFGKHHRLVKGNGSGDF